MPQASAGRSLRIGVWCDYGVTLQPTEGIGVFVYSLVSGLLQLENGPEIVLLVRPGDQHVASFFGEQAAGKLKVVPEAAEDKLWIRITDRARAAKKKVEHFAQHIRPALGVPRLQQSWKLFRSRPRLKHLGHVFVNLAGFFAGLLLSIVPQGTRRLLRACVSRAGRVERSAERHAQARTAEAAACDVWLIPSGDFRLPLTFPTVLALHDLVCIRFPEMWEKSVQQELEQTVRQRAAEATLCACMSAFIRDHDLRGILGLPPDKLRVIAPAPPVDADAPSAIARPVATSRPYVFYPAAFRSYKNHQILLEALPLLTAEGHDIDLVFTGIREMPAELREQCERLRIGERVHVLGCVDRATLADLYRGALATVIPALYEQGSFPIYEALRRQCPVACARIAPFQEQCAALGDAMLYFDPRSPQAVAETIADIAHNPDEIRRRQQEASATLWLRTWRDAAQEWLQIFAEAAARGKKEHATAERLAA